MTTLNLLFAEAERKGKTRNFQAYNGLGSDGSSADNLDLKCNPRDTTYFSTIEQDSLHAL